jgi:Zn-dependent peptidase ImmA (M78 family)
MERIKSINPDRVAWCCADRGITLDILSAELNISSVSLKRVLSGQGGITFNQLRNIAEYFGRGILFFLEDGPIDVAQVHTPEFRTLANQKPELSAKIKSLIERVERQREIYRSLSEDFEDAETRRFDPPNLSHTPQKAAMIVREWLGVEDINTFDSYRAAVEEKGILVFRSNGYTGKWQIAKESPILGFSLYHPECPVIVIKKQRFDAQQTFTLMHELGHLLLHKSSSIDDESDLLDYHSGHERAANAFAGQLLVPDHFLISVSDVDKPNDVSEYATWLTPQRNAWGVSTEVILRRLLDVGRLQQSEYLSFRTWTRQVEIPQPEGGTRQYRHREPKHIFGDRFVRTVLDSLHNGYITLNKASNYLDGLKISDLHQLERHYAGT